MGLENAGAAGHACWTSGSSGGYRDAIAAYLAEGVELGQRLVFYGSTRDDVDGLREALAASGQDADRLVGEERMVVGTAAEAYRAGEAFDPDASIARYRARVREALEDGFSGLRVAAETDWLVEDPEARRMWPIYEFRAELLAAELPFAALCCYEAEIWGSRELELIRAVHSTELDGDGSPEPVFRLLGLASGGIGLEGEVDLACAEEVESLLQVGARTGREPLIDLSGLRFADVAATRAVATAAQEMAAGRGRVEIRGASPTFRRVWSLLGFDVPDGSVRWN